MIRLIRLAKWGEGAFSLNDLMALSFPIIVEIEEQAELINAQIKEKVNGKL